MSRSFRENFLDNHAKKDNKIPGCSARKNLTDILFEKTIKIKNN